MIKTITTSFLATTLVATSVFAQDDRGPGMPPPGERRGEWGQD
jgi:hypothetical protein